LGPLVTPAGDELGARWAKHRGARCRRPRRQDDRPAVV